MIIKGAGLNTASWELSRLIAQYHPALKRLFSKGERAISGKLEIGQRIFYRGCWKAWVCGTESGDGELRCYLPLPTLPASKDILGVNNIRLNTEDVFSRDNLEV
jgi:hypothetical protein